MRFDRLPLNTETKISSFRQNFHHLLQRKLSKWQLPVQPVMQISSKWEYFRFSVRREWISLIAFALYLCWLKQWKQHVEFNIVHSCDKCYFENDFWPNDITGSNCAKWPTKPHKISRYLRAILQSDINLQWLVCRHTHRRLPDWQGRFPERKQQIPDRQTKAHGPAAHGRYLWNVMTWIWHKHALRIFQGSSLVSGISPTPHLEMTVMGKSDVFFVYCPPEQTVEQAVELPVFRETMSLNSRQLMNAVVKELTHQIGDPIT